MRLWPMMPIVPRNCTFWWEHWHYFLSHVSQSNSRQLWVSVRHVSHLPHHMIAETLCEKWLNFWKYGEKKKSKLAWYLDLDFEHKNWKNFPLSTMKNISELYIYIMTLSGEIKSMSLRQESKQNFLNVSHITWIHPSLTSRKAQRDPSVKIKLK